MFTYNKYCLKKKNLGNVFVITKYAGTDRENTETENPDS